MSREFSIRNPRQLLENMALIRDILQENNIQCFLYYGTLLGAIREHNFIPHDDDADLGVFGKHYDTVITLLPEFMRKGFSFESLYNGRVLQLIRKDEQVDLYFTYPVFSIFGRRWSVDTSSTVAGHFLNTLSTIVFPSGDTSLPQEVFLIPQEPEKLMLYLYGNTWRTPIKNVPSRHSLSNRLKKIIENPGQLFFRINRYTKTKIRIFEENRNFKTRKHNSSES